MANVPTPAAVTVGGQGAAAPAVPKAPPFTIHSLEMYTRWIKMIVYGPYGVGKTRLVGSSVLVPQMRDVLFIDCEAGDLTVATEMDIPYKEAAEKHFSVVRVSTFNQLARVQEYLKLHCKYRDEDNEDKLKEFEKALMGESFDPEAPAKRFHTVIVDSLSEAEAYSLYQLLGITDKTKLDEDVATAEWSDFRKNHSQILRLVRAFRDLPMNVLMTAADSYIQDEKKRMIWMPSLTGKLARQVQGFMDIVGYMFVAIDANNVKSHNLQIQPSANINAKCRFSNFKNSGWVNPTMLSILKDVGLLEKMPGTK